MCSFQFVHFYGICVWQNWCIIHACECEHIFQIFNLCIVNLVTVLLDGLFADSFVDRIDGRCKGSNKSCATISANMLSIGSQGKNYPFYFSQMNWASMWCYLFETFCNFQFNTKTKTTFINTILEIDVCFRVSRFSIELFLTILVFSFSFGCVVCRLKSDLKLNFMNRRFIPFDCTKQIERWILMIISIFNKDVCHPLRKVDSSSIAIKQQTTAQTNE